MKLDHIGIAVRNLEEANAIYTQLLGVSPYKEEFVAIEQVRTSFFRVGESKIELLASNQGENSVINRFIGKKGEGVHHIAFEVTNLEKEIERLKKEGFTFVSEIPKLGADQKRIVFLKPRNTKGVLIELCQSEPL